jgi:hypothetical protein
MFASNNEGRLYLEDFTALLADQAVRQPLVGSCLDEI